ncbi:MAG TPA: hypothetical protein ENN85_04520 [Methanoculleus sp.]|nr:hypothetical protein [Methanoculleus sp.]
MSDENPNEAVVESAGTPAQVDKRAAHNERIIRTAIACMMGILAGIASFIFAGQVDPATGSQPNAIIGGLILLAGIVFQRHIFMIAKIDYTALGGKDWFYQAFMTFSLWFISWTLLLTSTIFPQ